MGRIEGIRRSLTGAWRGFQPGSYKEIAMLVLIVLTISTGIFTLVAWYFASASYTNASAAAAEAWKIRKSAGAIEILRDDQAALEKRLAKLAGRFYRNLQDEPDPPDPDDTPESRASAALVESTSGLAVCGNWADAKLDGPGSAAAMCDCPYCATMRRARHDAKAALVPKSNADRIASMRKGLGHE